MMLDVLDPVAGLGDVVDLDGEVTAETAPVGDEPDEPGPGDLPPGGLPGARAGGRAGRGGAPDAEPATLMGAPPVDQAVFDAEFVAIVLAEAPWAEPQPGPARVPPLSVTGNRRSPPPRFPADRPARSSRTQTATGVLPEATRRPGLGPRSPPRHQPTPRSSTV